MVGVVLVVGRGGVGRVRVGGVLARGRLVLCRVRVGIVRVVSVMAVVRIVVRRVVRVVLRLIVRHQLGGRSQELTLTRHHHTWSLLPPLSPVEQRLENFKIKIF